MRPGRNASNLCSADAAVQQLSRRSWKAVGNMREDWFHLFCNPHPMTFAGKLGSSCSILDIKIDRVVLQRPLKTTSPELSKSVRPR